MAFEKFQFPGTKERPNLGSPGEGRTLRPRCRLGAGVMEGLRPGCEHPRFYPALVTGIWAPASDVWGAFSPPFVLGSDLVR